MPEHTDIILDVDALGFITMHQASYHSLIYTFCHYFEEKFTPFNHMLPPETIFASDKIIQYQKTYRSFSGDKLNTEHRIEQKNDGLIWNIRCLDDFNSDWNATGADRWGVCCFGISIELGSLEAFLYDGRPAPKIIRYSQTWTPTWKDNVVISVPIIQILLLNTKWMLCASPQDDLHMVLYHDSVPRLKVGALTDRSSSMEIRLLPLPNESDPIEVYKNLYPQSSELIDFWKAIFSKCSKYYGIEVLHSQPVKHGYIAGRHANQSQVHKFSNILWEQLQLYPQGFFRAIQLRTINLCSEITKGTIRLSGYTIHDGICLDISNNQPDYIQAFTLHHEIFHVIEKSLTVAAKSELLETVKKIKYAPFCLINSNEVCSEIFAYKMFDPIWMQTAEVEDDSVTPIIELILNHIQQLAPDFSWPKIRVSNDPIVGWIGGSLDKPSTSITVSKPEKHDGTIQGLPGTGLTLLLSVFKDIQILPFEPGNQPLGYLVRNPLDWAAREWALRKIPAEISLKKWVSTYRALAAHKLPFLRYEDLITMNKKAIRNFLNETGLKCDFDLSIVDANRIRYTRTTVPFLFSLWVSFRNQDIMEWYKYDQLQCSE